MSEPKRDCRFFHSIAHKEACYALKALYCAHGKCNFYKSTMKSKPQGEKEKKNA